MSNENASSPQIIENTGRKGGNVSRTPGSGAVDGQSKVARNGRTNLAGSGGSKGTQRVRGPKK